MNLSCVFDTETYFRYVKKRSLFYHMSQHDKFKHVCMECGQTFEDATEFKAHVDHHESEKSWKCPKCNDKFVRKQHLETHLLVKFRYHLVKLI